MFGQPLTTTFRRSFWKARGSNNFQSFFFVQSRGLRADAARGADVFFRNMLYPFIKEYQAVNLSDFAQSFYIKQPPSIFHEPHEHHSSGKETKAAGE